MRVKFKAPQSSGRSFVDLDRDTFLARLAALVPPPWFNTIRYYGVLSGRHALRPSILPPHASDEPRQLTLFEKRGRLELPSPGALASIEKRPLRDKHDEPRDPSPSRLAWATLLARVFAIDVQVCSRCGGPMKVRRAVTDPSRIAAMLHGARPPPQPPPPGQLALWGR